MSEALKLFGWNSDEVKHKSEELEGIDKQINSYNVKLENLGQQQSNQWMRRDQFWDEWNWDNLFPSAIKMLELQMKQHITLVGNIEIENKNAEALWNMQAWDIMMTKMEEQLKIRDNLIETASNVMKKNNLEIDLNHP